MRRLLIRPGAIGDTILSFPALEHLADADTEIWVRSEIVPLVGFGGRVRSIASSGLDMVEIDPPLKTMEMLGSFRKIVSWYGGNRAEFRDAVGGLPFEFLDTLPSGEGVHAADFFAGQVGAPVPAVPRIEVEPERHGKVVVHPFSGSTEKNWPFDRFRQVVDTFGGEWAHNRFERLDELACWLAGASVYVGNDSGITHLAAAVGVPVVGLFRKTDPAVWGPRGERVHIIRRRGEEEIDVDEVLHFVRSFL